MKKLNIEGQKFARLTAVKFHSRDKSGHRLWLFQCDCGNSKVAQVADVRSGKTNSCGCFQKERAREANITHGMSHKHPLYHVWVDMRDRCNRPARKDYQYYGGRGIKVCERWNDFVSFVSDMGDTFVEGLTLERINPFKNYEPSNCRWATWDEQHKNTRKQFVAHTLESI